LRSFLLFSYDSSSCVYKLKYRKLMQQDTTL
jgi:hypothetical protein